MATETRQLRDIALFAELTPAQLAALAAVCDIVHFPSDTRIIRQGEASDTFFIIRDGTVNITRTSERGNEVFLTMLGPGAYFGEAVLFQDVRRTANVTAGSDVELVTLSRAAFHRFLEIEGAAVGRILFHMMRSLFSRLDTMTHELQFLRGNGFNQDEIDRLTDGVADT